MWSGVDPKSILCEFYKVGQCAKGFKCKFSHDLNAQRKGEKIDLYSDKRDQGIEQESFKWSFGFVTLLQFDKVCSPNDGLWFVILLWLSCDFFLFEETMEDWDQETLEKVVESKTTEYKQNKPTDIVSFSLWCYLYIE